MVEKNFDYKLDREPLPDDQLELIKDRTTDMEHFRLAVGIGDVSSVEEILARTDEEVTLLGRAELIGHSVKEIGQMSEEELMIAEDEAKAQLAKIKQLVKMKMALKGRQTPSPRKVFRKFP
ncbi:MAG: hypothetical protein Q7R97_04190 [Candidatus Daviesbacteria bacterium]|nr:hypothetical protein [Candidatus Daviesbacteria bacterium]